MAPMKHCGACGGLLCMEVPDGDSRQRAVCEDCKVVHYDQLLIGAGALIERDSNLLLVHRSMEPFINSWALPGGHVEADEDPEAAIVREVREETALHAQSLGLAGAYFHRTHPRGPALFLSFWLGASQGAPSTSVEVAECRYFSRSAIPQDLALGGHSIAITSWRDSRTCLPQRSIVLSPEVLLSQLSNASSFRSSQDQVRWTIFGAFWATNALLVVALFRSGNEYPRDVVGIVLAIVGLALSLVWHRLQNSALHHLVRRERTIAAHRIQSGKSARVCTRT